MAAKRSRRSELAKTVPNHVFGDVHGDMPPTIVDGDRQANHFGMNHAGPAPGPDDLLAATARGFRNTLFELWMDIPPLFGAP